nr:alpha/beta hydrolase [Maliibacterium massiliense]
MDMHGTLLSSALGVPLHLHCWLPDAPPKAIVQIAHGMVEHAGRYACFAAALNAAGYGVYAHDHIGHGKTASALQQVGHIPEDGFAIMVQDQHRLNTYIRTQHPNLPIIYFGHSMGSLVGQRFIQDHGEDIACAVLSGTAGPMPVQSRLLRLVSGALGHICGMDRRAPFVDKLVFGAYNKAFAPARTRFDWLSRDDRQVDAYINDPYCGAICTYSFFNAFARGLMHLNDARDLAHIPKDLPLLLLSGSDDPVGVHLDKLLAQYQKLGLQDVTLDILPGARHELLNETNRDEVTQAIIRWLDAHLDKE